MFTIITMKQLKRAAAILLCALVLLCGGNLLVGRVRATAGEEKSFIKWVDFNVPYEALEQGAMKLDIALPRERTIPFTGLGGAAGLSGGQKRRGIPPALRPSPVWTRSPPELQEGKTMEELTAGS